MVSLRRYIPPPWVLVLIGLVLNIGAIIVTSLVLDKLGKQHSQLAEQTAENLYSIQLAWNSVETLERKREALLLHVHISKSVAIPLELEEVLAGHLSSWVHNESDEIKIDQLPQLMSKINQAQASYRDRIDNYYIENVELNEVMAKQDEKIAWYKNIGLFLQVFGLALILARDLARKQ
ncbi:DNA mismatch repair protein [Vibrio alginolyticus]|uniref:DNA mismatch repair protein n=1 Tax=Vibrio TaxID=662 RepID=UPI001BD27AC9|nr:MULTISPECIES: DNA mismatch repair protein [Vibrio]EGR2323434.1 DNA mismatch repair protein [Vibrio alginolyticus]EIF2701167.1 DNA mismatch repair protein [Vibrio alginolyticus]ELS4794208.1 DNA mismatch repair protein [Vibrio alginolyticus]MBT0065348.1 DNA mismatch repair protein [Vibrio alginolyticus]MDL0443714.1 DNA mismatch repair protein [Vibrio alginolyticus]